MSRAGIGAGLPTAGILVVLHPLVDSFRNDKRMENDEVCAVGRLAIR